MNGSLMHHRTALPAQALICPSFVLGGRAMEIVYGCVHLTLHDLLVVSGLVLATRAESGGRHPCELCQGNRLLRSCTGAHALFAVYVCLLR